jgi:hypothetical protein
VDFARQVAPGRIGAIDQSDLLATTPTFQLLFPGNGIGGGVKGHDVDQPTDPVLCRMSNSAQPMLDQPPAKVGVMPM